ncbi:hypothetical protein GCM10027020_11360 [Nocardioides salsibiostraticola]
MVTRKPTVGRESAVNPRGFVSTGGVTLNAHRKDAECQALTVGKVVKRPAKICGYDSSPIDAKLVKEMRY